MVPGKKIKSETFLSNPSTVGDGVPIRILGKPTPTKNPDRGQGCLWFEMF